MLRLLQNLFDLFFPKTCLGCQIILLSQEKTICTTCRHQMPLTETHLLKKNEIKDTFEGLVPLEHVSSLFYFYKNHFTQELIHNLKYRGFEEIGNLFGLWYGHTLAENELLLDVDYIIPIPLHKKRLKERGFNQVEKFGLALSKVLSTPYYDKLLVRNTYASKQSKKTKKQRLNNPTDWFGLNKRYHDFQNKHLLLIDDVITTGTTIEVATKTLLQIPNCKISVVSIAFAKN